VSSRWSERLLALAARLALIALALIVWSVFDPRPIVLVMAMSLGQGIGTLSFLLFGFVVVRELWVARIPRPPEPRKED
jgi:hypothetical protein